MQVERFRDGPGSVIHTPEGLVHFILDLDALAIRMKLPSSVKGRADSIAKSVASMRSCRLASRAVLAAAALYVACRECREPVTLRELAATTGTDARQVGRCYATILERMHITRPGLGDRQYVHRLALSRPLSAEVYEVSEDIIGRAARAGLGGRNPMTLAAAALYLACCSMGEKITQAEVSDAAGIGEESVRECCKAIRAYEGVVAAWHEPGPAVSWRPQKPN